MVAAAAMLQSTSGFALGTEVSCWLEVSNTSISTVSRIRTCICISSRLSPVGTHLCLVQNVPTKN